MKYLKQAMNNIMPVLEVKARRIGGATYQVPMEVRPERRQTLGLEMVDLTTLEKEAKRHERKTCRRINGCYLTILGAAVKKKRRYS